MGNVVKSGMPCPDQNKCGSSDAAALYDDGSMFCYSCKQYFTGKLGREHKVHSSGS